MFSEASCFNNRTQPPFTKILKVANAMTHDDSMAIGLLNLDMAS